MLTVLTMLVHCVSMLTFAHGWQVLKVISICISMTTGQTDEDRVIWSEFIEQQLNGPCDQTATSAVISKVNNVLKWCALCTPITVHTCTLDAEQQHNNMQKNYCGWIWPQKQRLCEGKSKHGIVCGCVFGCGGGWKSMWREKILEKAWSPSICFSATFAFRPASSPTPKLLHPHWSNEQPPTPDEPHALPSLNHCVPAGWERSSRRASPSGRRSDGPSACRFHWTWFPGSRQGGAGFAAAPCLRSETGWTSSPLQEDRRRRRKDSFTLRTLIKTFCDFDHKHWYSSEFPICTNTTE